MRRCVVLVLLLWLSRTAVGAPRPDEPAPEPISVDQAADAVITAAKAKDAATLKSLAEADVPDPWLVADLLCTKAELDAAEAFAKASSLAASKALPGYVQSQRGHDPEAAARKALSDASDAISAGEYETAFAKLDGIAAKGDSVLASHLWSVRGTTLRYLGRHEQAALAFTSAGAIAGRIGWVAQAGGGYHEAGIDAWSRSDFRGAFALWQKALPYAEAGTNRVFLAGVLLNLAVIQETLGDWKQAVVFHERAVKLWEELKDGTNLAKSYSNLGTLHANLGDLEKSLDFHTKALNLRQAIGEPTSIGASLASIGAVHRSRGDYPKAVDSFTRALALQRGAEDAKGTAYTLASLGQVRADLGEMKKALALEEEARSILMADEEANKDLIAEIQVNVGWIQYLRGDYGRALETLAQALEVAEKIGAARLEALCLTTLGAVHLRLGDYPRAMGILKRAKKAADRLGDRATQCAILGQIGEIHRLLGEYPKALEIQESSQRLAEESGNRTSLAMAISNVANIYFSLGDVTKAIELYERARALAEKLGHRSYIAVCLANLGVSRTRLKDYAGALEHQRKALAILEELGDRIGIARTLANAADVHILSGQPEKALALLERSQRIREELKDRAGLTGVSDGLGDAYRALKEPKKALGFYESAALEADRLGEQDLLVDALTGAAEAHLDLGEAALALEKAKRAASFVDRLTHGQGEEQGAATQEQYARLYDAGTRAAALLSDLGQAAFFLETGRAGTLLESLGGREFLRSWSLPPELLAVETKARADESAAFRAYTDALETDERAPIRARRAELETARATLEAVIERITRESKATISVPSKAATLVEMQRYLEPDDALVLYLLLPEEGLALVMTPDAARLVRLGKTSVLEAACAALSLSDPNSDPMKGRDALREAVAAKLELPEKTKRVIVSSEGALSYVPFSLLFPGKLVAYVPSGTAYGQLRVDRRMRGEGVLALGDPDYRGADANAVALVRGGPRLVSLPGTRIEAKAVGDVVLLGADATVSSLKTAVSGRPRWHAIHLGCHGLVDPEKPMRCSLALTPEAGNSGLLLAQDVGLLKMPTDLAVLSACETMKGKIYRGEGIVGITRMFMYAGAPRLLTSLWKVDDEATRALMIKFYELWNPKDGSKPLGTAEALAAAQEHVRSQEKWKHPYYWAAWVLWGLPD